MDQASDMSDRRDPICGMAGTIERHGHWFCSERCIAEHERRMSAGAACEVKRRHWLSDPWVWAPLTGLVMATMGAWWPTAHPVSAVYAEYLRKVGVPFLIGLLFGGFIDHFVPKTYIVKLLTGQRKRVIARSTLFGFLASSCSHGCLALTLELSLKS